MNIKISKRFLAILVAAGVSASLRACSGTLSETSKTPQPKEVPIYEVNLDFGPKEGYILDSNFDFEDQAQTEIENEITQKR